MSNKINFTVETIKNLTYSKTKTTYYYDKKMLHHRLVITRKGYKTFQLYMRVEGVPTKRTLGVYPDISPERARELAKTLMAELILGNDKYSEKQKLKNEPTYTEIWEDYFIYLKNKANKKPKTAEKNIGQYLSNYKKSEPFHNLKLHEITTTKLIKFHREYTLVKGKPIMANNILRQIRACFYYANYEPNPAASKKIKFNKANKRTKYFRNEEMQAFINSALKYENENFRDIFLLCLFTAARIGSIMAMEWKDLKLNHGVWEPVTKTSDNENDIMPIGLNERAVEILQNRKKLSTVNIKWVFPANSKSGHITQPQKAFKAICKNAGLIGFTPHDLRRTAISQFAQNGASDQEILTLLGNKTLDTKDIYAQRNVLIVNERYSVVLDNILKDIKVI